MNRIMKILFVNLFFVLLSALFAAETIFVPKNSLLFRDMDGNRTWEIKAKTQQDFIREVTSREKFFLEQGTEIGIYAEVCHLKIPGSDELCFFPGISFKKGKDGKITPCPDKIDSLMFLGSFIIAIGFALLAGFYFWRSEKKKYLLPAALLLFFWGYACWYIGFRSDAFITPSDETHYFDIAKKLMSLDFTSMKYRYTIGFPILCIPFIFLFHLQNCLEFVCAYMNFQTFILIPGLFLALYMFFYKKMGISRIQSFCILLLWLILMIFYFPIKSFAAQAVRYIPDNYLCNACFSLLKDNLYFSFVQFTWLGRDALCDHAVFFLFVILLYVSMKKSRSLLRFFILSMGFGLVCLVRINYIFFAPLLAFAFFDSFSELWKNKRNYLYAALCGTAGFMIVFIWQFVLNKIQFGSPFVWPYSLHAYAPDRGFVWSVVPYGFKFLCQTNYVYLTVGISSLFFIPERKIRVLLALWIFPMLFFFTGYPIIFHSPNRFILPLYAPLCAAIVLNPVWTAAWSIRIKAALVVAGSCVLCKSNIFFNLYQPWNLGAFGISNIDFMIIQGVICLFCCAVIYSMRKELRADYANTISHLRFLILFTAVFFLGSAYPYIVGILVLAASAYGLRDTWGVIRQGFSRTK